MKKLLYVLAYVAVCNAAYAFDREHKMGMQVYFDTNQDQVTEQLPLVVSEGDNVTIVGHADVRHSHEYNEALAERRARSVAAALGLSDANILTMGEREARAECPDLNPVCLQIDRRVDVFVECGIDTFACTAEPPYAWGPDSDPIRVVSDRSRF